MLPQTLGAQSASERQPQFTPEGTESCLVCHSGEKMQLMQNGAHGLKGGPDSPMSQKGCESCHGPGSFHVSRAHGGAGFPAMIYFGTSEDAASRDVQIRACLDCHQSAVAEVEAIAFVGSPHDDEEINCSSCHQGHVEQDPILVDRSAEAENCFSCHEDMREGHNPFEGRSIDLDSLNCSTCHDVHAVNTH